MKRSEFQIALDGEFGELGRTLVRDVVLDGFGMTAADCISAGVPPREVWAALCHAMEVPDSRIHGVGLLEPKG